MKIYKDFHNLSFLRHILQKFHFGFKFYCAYYQFRDRFHCAKQKNLSVSLSLDSSPTEGSLWREGKVSRSAKASPR